MPDNLLSILPEVSFAPGDIQTILAEMVRDYEQAYLDATGEQISLAPASEERIILYSQALRFFHIYQLIDQGCKMNLPQYSRDGYLDHLASLLGLVRLPAQPSYIEAEFTLSAPLTQPVTIPKGTRLSTQTNIFFALQDDVVIPAGNTSITGNAKSIATGTATAGFSPGQISILVDPVPYVASAENLTSSQGGADIETDDHLRFRIQEFPDSKSTAGPASSYLYHIRAISQAVEGVSITSPAPGEIDIRITLTGGQLPNQAFLDDLYDQLESVRPLTDSLTIAAPEVQEYQIEVTYYLPASARTNSAAVQALVEAAAGRYQNWQGEQIGRDIVPDKLISLMVEAGAKRVTITQPVYTPIAGDTLCVCSGQSLTFGGIEDD